MAGSARLSPGMVPRRALCGGFEAALVEFGDQTRWSGRSLAARHRAGRAAQHPLPATLQAREAAAPGLQPCRLSLVFLKDSQHIHWFFQVISVK